MIKVKLITGKVLCEMLASVLPFALTHIFTMFGYSLCIFIFWLIFEGRSRDKTKAIKGYEEIAWSRRERTQDNVFSEGQSEITEELPVLQNKII